MKAKVFVTLKKGIADPQGFAVRNALDSMGFFGVKEVRIGKLIELETRDGIEITAETVEEMCRSLFANTIMEDFSFQLQGEEK